MRAILISKALRLARVKKMVLYYIHHVSKNVPHLACYNFDAHEWILIFLAEMLPIK